jgi:hypothetical protein
MRFRLVSLCLPLLLSVNLHVWLAMPTTKLCFLFPQAESASNLLTNTQRSLSCFSFHLCVRNQAVEWIGYRQAFV